MNGKLLPNDFSLSKFDEGGLVVETELKKVPFWSRVSPPEGSGLSTSELNERAADGDGDALMRLGARQISEARDRTEFEQGIEYLAQAVASGNAEATYRLGRALEWVGQYEEAYDAFRRGDELGFGPSVNRLALHLISRDQRATALEMFERSARLGVWAARKNSIYFSNVKEDQAIPFSYFFKFFVYFTLPFLKDVLINRFKLTDSWRYWD